MDLRAIDVVEKLRDERFEEVAALFARRLRAVASVDTLRTGWTVELDRLGPISAIGVPADEPVPRGLTGWSVPVTCERGGLRVLMSFDRRGRLHGLRLAGADVPWTPPSYADESRFSEREVTVDGLPGTLTLPGEPTAGVVLLSGGGAFDRDETVGPNKIMKDLAWGLASRGVAVLRFDKVTYVDSAAASRPGFTAVDEYVPAAVAAIRLLRETVERVYVLGHSMGGKIAPRVAAAEPSVAGLVVLAGDTKPMHWNAVRVARYLAAVNPTMGAALATMERQATVVASPDLSTETPADQLLFGFSASYWLDMRAYDPVATAVSVNKPMLILQGGRDYQVTAEHDLAGWRVGLGDRATIRVYDADDHMFFTGGGPSLPADYERPQHVDPAAVHDIADWLAAG